MRVRSYLFIVVFLIAGLFAAEVLFAQGRGGPAPVSVARVESSNESAAARFVGTAAAIRHTVIGSAVEGRIESVFVDEGDLVLRNLPQAEVEQDDTDVADTDTDTDTATVDSRSQLVQVRTQTLEIEIRRARASLQSLESGLQLLTATLENEIQDANNQLESAEADEDYAVTNFNRVSSILESSPGAISAEEVEISRTNMASAVAAKKSAAQRLALLEQTRREKIVQAEADLEVAQAGLDLLLDQHSKYTIRAPFDGFVTIQHVEVGDWISRGDPVVELMQLDPIELRVNVPEEYIGSLQARLQQQRNQDSPLFVAVQVSALAGKTYRGEVVRIVPDADRRSRAFPVIVHIPNPPQDDGSMIQSGMLGQVDLPITARNARMMVPKDSVVLNGTTYHVMVIDEGYNDDGGSTYTARTVPVSVGVAVGSQIEVRGDLQAGEMVVVEGNERLRTGQAVKILDGDN